MPAKRLQFISQNKQIIYAIILLLVIPGVLILNTVFLISRFQKSIDQELYHKSIALAQVVNAGLVDDLKNLESTTTQAKLQAKLKQIADFNPQITSLSILSSSSQGFRVVADLNDNLVGQEVKNIGYAIAWQKDQPTAYLTKRFVNGQENRFWVITMPLRDSQKNKVGLLALDVSLSFMDQLTQQVLAQSYFILFLTVLLVVLLLINTTRLFQYAVLYRKLREVDKMKDEFISMASHELRTPVTGIRGYISMFLDGSFGPLNEKMRQSLLTIEKSSQHLATLVEDLLNVSRIEQGRLKIEPQLIEIAPVILEVIEELKPQAQAKKIDLKYYQKAKVLPKLKLDKNRFRQILINLVGNAIKYTPQGSVEVIVESQENKRRQAVLIKIKDTGIGMSAQERKRLGEKFYRVRNEKTAGISGTGLGLWITKQLVEIMGGQIMIDSIEGVGTQVTLRFMAKKD